MAPRQYRVPTVTFTRPLALNSSKLLLLRLNPAVAKADTEWNTADHKGRMTP